MKKTVKKIIMGSVLFGTFLFAIAQVPTTPPPVPSYPANEVKAVFSNSYPQFAKFDLMEDWGDSKSEKQIITVDGNRLLKIDKITNSSYSNVSLGTCNWNDMDTIRIDIYSPGDNMGIGEFDFQLNNNFSGGTDAGIWYDITGQGKHDQWITIKVPVKTMRDKGIDMSKISMIKFRRGRKGSPGQLLYVGNLFAYKGEGGDTPTPPDPTDPIDPKPDPGQDLDALAPPAPAPTPTNLQANVKAVFSDHYTQWAKFDLTNDWGTSVTKKEIIHPFADYPADRVLRIDDLTNGPVSNISIGTCDWNDMDTIHMDIFSPGNNMGIGEFEFQLSDFSGNGVQADIWLNITGKNLHGQWIRLDIPLAKFKTSTNQGKFNMIRIRRGKQGSTGKLLYVDNIFAYKKGSHDNPEPPEPPAPIGEPTTVPTVSLDKSNVISIFCEQFEEPDYQATLGIWDVSGGYTLDDPYTTSKMNYGQNKDQDRKFVEIVPGNKSIHLTDWNDYPFKVHKTSETMDLSDMDYLHISAYLMSEPQPDKAASMTFFMHDDKNKLDNPIDVGSVDMQPGKWVSISIPLCFYKNKGLDMSKVYVLRPRLGGYSSMDVYIDNIFAYKGEAIGATVKCPDDPDVPKEPIQDKTAGELPPIDQLYFGVNLASASGGSNPGTFGYDYLYPKNEDLYYFKAKGVRLIRLPFRWARIQSELNGELTMRDVNEMKRVVAEAERLGMWVMLDSHDYCERAIDGKLYEIGVAGHKEWNTSSNSWGPRIPDSEVYLTAEHFADYWVKLANEFKGYSNIWGYDLMNEPKDIDINILKNNYQKVINEIRKVDTKTTIVVEGKNYAAAKDWPNASDALKDLTDPSNNIIYQAHTYFDRDNSGSYKYDYDYEIRNPEVYKERLDPFINWLKANNKKGMLGEFGVPYNGAKNSDERYMELIDKTFAYLKENNLTSTYWCGGAMYDAYQLTIQPAKDFFTEKSTMKVMEKYLAGGNSIESNFTDANENVNLYPNPVRDILNINCEIAVEEITIYNLLGQQVKTLKVDNNTVNIESLSKGNYLVKMKFENGLYAVKQIIKQ